MTVSATAGPLGCSLMAWVEDWMIFLCSSRSTCTRLLFRKLEIATAFNGESQMVQRVALGVFWVLLNHCDGEITTRFLKASFA